MDHKTLLVSRQKHRICPWIFAHITWYSLSVIICRFQVQYCFTFSVKFVIILSHLTQGNPKPAKKKVQSRSTSAFLINLVSKSDLHSYLVIRVCPNFGTVQNSAKTFTTFALFVADETYFTLKYIRITFKCSVIFLDIIIIVMYGRKVRQTVTQYRAAIKKTFLC
jgi:hypothetical protein